jgi:hypothetical protein
MARNICVPTSGLKVSNIGYSFSDLENVDVAEQIVSIAVLRWAIWLSEKYNLVPDVRSEHGWSGLESIFLNVLR